MSRKTLSFSSPRFAPRLDERVRARLPEQGRDDGDAVFCRRAGRQPCPDPWPER